MFLRNNVIGCFSNNNSDETTTRKVEKTEPFLIRIPQNLQKDMEVLQNVVHLKLICKLDGEYLNAFTENTTDYHTLKQCSAAAVSRHTTN